MNLYFYIIYDLLKILYELNFTKMGARNINAIHDDINPNNPNNIININDGEENQQNLIPIEEQNHIVQERTITKKVFAARLPSNLNKKTLSLEHDALFQDKSYIKFNYDSLFDIDCYINFNVSEKSEFCSINQSHKLSYSPSENFKNKGFYCQGLKGGENIEFFNNETFIDLRNYFNDKSDSQNTFDVCIEFVPLFPPGSPEIEDKNEIVFVTLCNFERHQEDNSYIIKCMKQRLRTHGIWIDLYDIFDSALEGGLCLICCSEIRNTIFLPCKHAGCCNKCGSEIKYRFKPCPICKTPIDDLLIINSDEKRMKIENESDEYIESSDNYDNTDSNIIINTNTNKNIINDSNSISRQSMNEEEALIPNKNNKENNDEIENKDNIDNEKNIFNEDNINNEQNKEKNINIIENDIKNEEIININNEINNKQENFENNYIKLDNNDDKGE